MSTGRSRFPPAWHRWAGRCPSRWILPPSGSNVACPSGRFGGADADLLIDDPLIEVKVIRHLRLKGEYLQPLTGYLVLDRLAGVHGSTLPV